MFSKEESSRIRKEFWVSFGKSFPKKWLSYNTKIKGFSFKFIADRKSAMVAIDIDNPDPKINRKLFENIHSFRQILKNDFIDGLIYDSEYPLETGKLIHRIYIPLNKKFSIHNKNTWSDCFTFFLDKMNALEAFYFEYEDSIKA